METHKPTIEVHGPVAFHDQACAVYHNEPASAVLDLSTGVFQPCWQAQQYGWRLVKADTWFKRLALRVAFSGGGKHDVER